MLLSTLVLESLVQTADGNASSLADVNVGILETGLDDGPHLAHERSHEFAATVDGDAKGEHVTTAMVGIRGTEVLDDDLAKRREDLRRGESNGERIDNAESRL